MPAMPPDFSASEVLTAAKLNQYMEYMESLPVHQATQPGELIFGDSATNDTWLSKPVTAFEPKIRTLANTSSTDPKVVELGPYITLDDCEALFYLMDGRIQVTAGTPNTSSLQVRQITASGGSAPTEFYRVSGSIPVRAGISGVLVPETPGSVTVTVSAVIAPSTTVLTAQTRLTVIKVRRP